MNKTKATIKKIFYLSLSVLEISKTVMFESWYDYIALLHDY